MTREKQKEPLSGSELGGSYQPSLSLPFHFPREKTSFSIQPFQLCLIVQLMIITGLRVREVLSIEFEDLIRPDTIHIKPCKRSIERNIHIPKDTWDQLFKLPHIKKTIFCIGYKNIYRFIKSGRAGIDLLKNDKNFSVCHTLRKLCIRRKLFDERMSVKDIVQDIGWQSETSILYYI